jgi:hypothetical protein
MRLLMNKKIYVFLMSIILLFIFGSCDDPLKIDEDLQVSEITAVDMLPARNLTYCSVNLYWSEFAGDEFNRYEVYYAPINTGKYYRYLIVKDSKINYIKVSGLTPDRGYSFFIRTVTKDGSSADSKAVYYKTYSDIPSPISYINYQAHEVYNKDTKLSSMFYTISWSKYIDTFAVNFSRYTIYYWKYGDLGSQNPTVYGNIYYKNENYINLDLTSLKENTIYYFIIRTYNALSNFVESDYVSFTTPYYAPAEVTLSPNPEIINNAFQLNWTKSTCTSFDRYEVHVSRDLFIPALNNVNNTRKGKITSIETTQYTLSGLESDQEYICRVLVYNKSGIFSYSNWVGITTTKDGNPIPLVLKQSQGSDITSNSITINWSASGAKFFASYKIYISELPNQTISTMKLVNTVVEQNINTYTITGLKSNTKYYINVPVFNAFGRNSQSNMIEVQTN